MRTLWGFCLVLLLAARGGPEVVTLGYLGGAGTDDCDGVALDTAGDVYLACHSDSNGSMDALIVKVEARTGRVVWTTRTGGSSWDAAGEVEVARDGSLVVLGSTRSADFPTTADAVQRVFGGGTDRDVFLLKLDAHGKIVYSTLLGGSKNEEATGLAVAEDGTVYLGGVTMSPEFAAGSRLGSGGQQDGFLASLHPGDPKSLRTLRLGGKAMDHVTGLALDRAGNLFATGYTSSEDFPTMNAVQAKFGGEVDAFLVKLKAADWSLQFGTYLGGSKADGAYTIALDGAGNPVISGVSNSTDFTTTEHAFQTKRKGTIDAFVSKLDGTSGKVLWSTYYGGSKENSDQFLGGSVAVDGKGRVWLTGMTNSLDLPLKHAQQSAFGGGDFDGFLAAFSADGSTLEYGSYVGGNGHDILEGIAVGRVYVWAAGITSSRDLRQKQWAAQGGYGGGPYDALVMGMALREPGTR